MKPKVNTYKDLIVWQKSMALVSEVYLQSNKISKDAMLANTLRRTAISIPSNIAEGWGRQQTKSYQYFLSVARGSLFELETQLLIASEQYELDIRLAESLLSEIGKMLNKMIVNLRGSNEISEPEQEYEVLLMAKS